MSHTAQRLHHEPEGTHVIDRKTNSFPCYAVRSKELSVESCEVIGHLWEPYFTTHGHFRADTSPSCLTLKKTCDFLLHARHICPQINDNLRRNNTDSRQRMSLDKEHFGLDVIFCCAILATNLYENRRLCYRLK